MLSLTDLTSQAKAKQMMKLNYIDNIKDNNKILYITQITNLQTVLNTKVQYTNQSFLDNLTLNSNLSISGNNILQSNVYINNLNISQNIILKSTIMNNAIINNTLPALGSINHN